MSSWFIFILLTSVAIGDVLSEKSEYGEISELVKNQFNRDKLLGNIARVGNSSKAPFLSSNDTDKGLDKKSRTEIQRFKSEFPDNSSCCGSRYSSSGSGTPDFYYNKITANNGRHPSRYGERLPVDRYGWQADGQSAGTNGRLGGGNHVGIALYQGNGAGDRFASRPNYASENLRKPASYESGGYGSSDGGYVSLRPTSYGGSSSSGSYGIAATFASGDQFKPMEPNFPQANTPSNPNIQAQKAVALKALAGVALIGAAAALATNPVLLPIGIMSGRRKRSSPPVTHQNSPMEYLLTAAKRNFIKVYDNQSEKKFSLSPTCVAKFACELQKSYFQNLGEDVHFIKRVKKAEPNFTHLMSNNLLQTQLFDPRVRTLIEAASAVATKRGNCNLFTCTLIKTIDKKSQNTFKL